MDAMSAWDTVVVGGGLAGLTAAIVLAQAGQSVAVYEQTARVGGRATTRVREQFRFNLGPHAIYRGFSAETTLTNLGIDLHGKPPIIGRNARAQNNGQLYHFPATATTILRSKLLSGRAKIGFIATALKIQRAQPAAYRDESWATWVEREIADRQVRNLFVALGRLVTYANAPDLIRADVVLRQFSAVFGSGVCYLDGGWQQIVDALLNEAQKAGVSIYLQQPVQQIVYDRATGSHRLTLRDGVVSAENIVVAIPPRNAQKLLPNSTALAGSVAQQTAVVAASLTLGLRQLPNPQITFAMGIDRPLYYSLHSAAAELAPRGQHVVHLAYYRPNSAVDEDVAVIRAELENFMQQLQPDWRAQLVTESYLPSLAVYHALPQVGQARPPIVSADTPNCYFVGDWVASGQLLADGAFASAEQAAAAILATARNKLL